MENNKKHTIEDLDGGNEDVQENEAKKSKPSADIESEKSTEINRENMCIVCMEEHSSEHPLLEEHQCGQCSKTAWKICVCCNDSLLSRICPICRGDYAPILLNVVPGAPLSQLADKSLTPEAKTVLLYKFGIVRHLISKSNVAVWNPDTEEMHFSLPREFAEDSKEISCLCVTIPMKAERIMNGTFTFNNAVWDEIEQEVEHGTEQSGVMMLSKDAVQWLLSFTRHSGHQILSMMSTADWEPMLDPSKNAETADILQSIQANISRAHPNTDTTASTTATDTTATVENTNTTTTSLNELNESSNTDQSEL